jgi:hypothetical protein
MRRLTVIPLLMGLGCGEDGPVLCTFEVPPVTVMLENAANGRPISDAAVMAGDVRLVETRRGVYVAWTDEVEPTVTATHAMYEPAEGRLELTESVCGSGLFARIEMQRFTPCPGEIVAGAEIVVVEVETGAIVEAANVQLADGPYVETLGEDRPGVYRGAFDRPGYYALRVGAAGYAPHEGDDVWVAEDDCSVVTTRHLVELRRAR